jgi:hypothetical protein
MIARRGAEHRDLALLRWHLGEEGDCQGEYEYPLWDARGPARRIGGVLAGELRSDDWGWALTVRQESHPDEFDDLRRIVLWLGAVRRARAPSGTSASTRTMCPMF